MTTLTVTYLIGSGPERANITLDREMLADEAHARGADRALTAALDREIGRGGWGIIGSEWVKATSAIARAAYTPLSWWD